MGPSFCKPLYDSPKLQTELLTSQFLKYKQQPYQYPLEIMHNHFKWTPNEQSQYRNFFKDLTALYNAVPYHNITHAFDVMTAIDKFMIEYDMMKKLSLSTQERIYILMAAYAHDSGHQGFTNGFYNRSGAPLAIRYSYSSPLQNMHSANLLECLRSHEIEIKMQYRQMMVKLILATDNKHHFQLLNKIKNLSFEQKKSYQKQPRNPKQKEILLEMLIHTADINNCGKPLSEYMLWNERLYQEFRQEYKKQTDLGLQHSFNFDINHWQLSVANSNVGFFNNLVIPFFKEVHIIMPKFQQFTSNAIKIRQYFQGVTRREKAKSQSQQKQHNKK